MTNFVDVSYQRTGKSLETDKYGMREMQKRVFAQRDSQYLLLKAPPASGKSRALMFLGLDKIYNQGIKKVIVAVPEKVIGGSFQRVKLTKHGYFADWDYNEDYNYEDYQECHTVDPGFEKIEGNFENSNNNRITMLYLFCWCILFS